MPVTFPTFALTCATSAPPLERTRSVTSAFSTGAPSERSVRWMRNWLGFPALSGSYSKKFSIRPVNSVRDSASSSCSASACGREPHEAAKAKMSRRPNNVIRRQAVVFAKSGTATWDSISGDYLLCENANEGFDRAVHGQRGERIDGRQGDDEEGN